MVVLSKQINELTIHHTKSSTEEIIPQQNSILYQRDDINIKNDHLIFVGFKISIFMQLIVCFCTYVVKVK